MGVPVNPHPPTPSSFPCFCKIKMRGSSKMAWIDAVRTTRYRLILMLCYDVFKFLVKQGVPSDEDLEWLYPSCLLYEKESFLRFRSIATRDIDHMWPNPFIWRWLGLKKEKRRRTRYLLFAYVGVDFSCKTMHCRDAQCNGTNWT